LPNHLLQEVLSDYDGTILLVSHDRDFIDRLVTRSFVFEGDGRVTEYAGGYSDYVTQRKQVERNIETERSSAKLASFEQAKAPKPSVKLSYKDQRQLEILPVEIEKLGGEIQQMEATLADPSLYSKNTIKFNDISNALEKARESLEEKEMRWLELDALKEGL
jgi:ABC transport system ATP-binding/permease protein